MLILLYDIYMQSMSLLLEDQCMEWNTCENYICEWWNYRLQVNILITVCVKAVIMLKFIVEPYVNAMVWSLYAKYVDGTLWSMCGMKDMWKLYWNQLVESRCTWML